VLWTRARQPVYTRPADQIALKRFLFWDESDILIGIGMVW